MSWQGRPNSGPLATRQNRLVLAAVGAGLVLALLLCYGRMSASRSAASAAAEDLAECRAMAGRIEALRRRPAVADARALRPTDLARRIELARQAADFPDDQIERIEPEPARRVGDSPYKETPTLVRLRRITLQQAFTFLHALSSDGPAGTVAGGGPGLRVRTVRLSAPRGEEVGDRWSVESTLSYLVYDPKLTAGNAAGDGKALAGW